MTKQLNLFDEPTEFERVVRDHFVPYGAVDMMLDEFEFLRGREHWGELDGKTNADFRAAIVRLVELKEIAQFGRNYRRIPNATLDN